MTDEIEFERAMNSWYEGQEAREHARWRKLTRRNQSYKTRMDRLRPPPIELSSPERSWANVDLSDLWPSPVCTRKRILFGRLYVGHTWADTLSD